MKPSNVSSLVFVDDGTSVSSSFLLQGALHLAEQGSTVCVISTKEVQSLPPSLHGIVMSGPDVFGLIRFLYLPTWQDLLQHLYSIHMHTHVPSVIILESAEDYFITNIDKKEENEGSNTDLKQASLVCASLIDAAAVCAKRLKKKSHVLLSIKQSRVPESALKIILNTFFNEYRWYVKTEPASENSSMGTIVLTSQNRKNELRFSKDKDMALILREIINVSVP